MQTAKQAALKTITPLPEDVDMEKIMYQLYLLEKVRKGRQDAAEGKITDVDALKREITQW